jgi:hypothetical protein
MTGMATTPGRPPTTPVPVKRSNLPIYLLGTVVVLVLGILIAAAILLVTGRAKTPKMEGLIRFGQAKSLTEKALDGGPFAYAGSTGDTGFWVALEDGKLVALKIRKPGTKDCNVIWRGSRNTFVDCHGDPVKIDELARYRVVIPAKGDNKGQFLVDLSSNIPPPAG